MAYASLFIYLIYLLFIKLFILKKTGAGQHHEKNGEKQRESRDEFLSGMPGKANELLQEYSYI